MRTVAVAWPSASRASQIGLLCLVMRESGKGRKCCAVLHKAAGVNSPEVHCLTGALRLNHRGPTASVISRLFMGDITWIMGRRVWWFLILANPVNLFSIISVCNTFWKWEEIRGARQLFFFCFFMYIQYVHILYIKKEVKVLTLNFLFFLQRVEREASTHMAEEVLG